MFNCRDLSIELLLLLILLIFQSIIYLPFLQTPILNKNIAVCLCDSLLYPVRTDSVFFAPSLSDQVLVRLFSFFRMVETIYCVFYNALLELFILWLIFTWVTTLC